MDIIDMQHEHKVKYFNGGGSSSWDFCGYAGCPGAKVPGHDLCYLHLPAEQRRDYLHAVHKQKYPLELSGLTITGPEFSAIMAAMPVKEKSPYERFPIMPHTSCRGTLFPDKINAHQVIWNGHVDFTNAQFAEELLIQDGTFNELVDFSGAKLASINASHCKFKDLKIEMSTIEGSFNLSTSEISSSCSIAGSKMGSLYMRSAVLKCPLNLQGATTGSGASGHFDLTSAKITGGLNCIDARFPVSTAFGSPYRESEPSEVTGLIDFRGATFGDQGKGRCVFAHMELKSADFSDSIFHGRVTFSNITMTGRCELQNIRHEYDLNQDSQSVKQFKPTLFDGFQFKNVSFDEAIELKNWKSSGEVQLNSITSDKAIEVLDADIKHLSLQNVGCLSFSGLGSFSTMNLSRCKFSNGGQVRSGVSEFNIEQCSSSAPFTIAPLSFEGKPSILALNGTDLNNFIFSGLDLRRARIETAANVDKVAIQGPILMHIPPVLRSRRAVLLGEIAYRSETVGRRSWRKRASADVLPIPSASELQASYRALRKAQEDRKDEPGSADFYYGEMEMRRLASTKPSSEWIILTLYWLVSGYGLRAWRSLMILIIILTGSSVLIHRFGLINPVELADAFLFSIQNSLSINNAKLSSSLNAVGSWIQVVQRVCAPAFIALALLALRGRVKR
ncbi:pentapeptide repeat-containing protein [Streptosporangium sp. NPDC006930]|uniref:pentapeptide repeat-containing protein n=1 Tax=Streptosporangium sp. NPDC006930 TaxID=3154783 RepID=UPI0034174A58